MQDNHVDMQDNYVNLQNNNVDMQATNPFRQIDFYMDKMTY